MATEKYIGHLTEKDYLKPPEFWNPNLRSITLVMGSPVSDLGKGWTTAAIASELDGSPLVIKIDPMLKPDGFPTNIGVEREGKIVTEDFAVYESLGVPTSPENNIVLGVSMKAFYNGDTRFLRKGVEKK